MDDESMARQMACNRKLRVMMGSPSTKMAANLLLQTTLVLALFLRVSWAQTADNPLQYEIMEDLLPGSAVGNIKEDAGLVDKYSEEILDTLSFSFLTAGDIKDYFAMDDASGNLVNAKIVDRDVICPRAVRCVVRLDIGVHPPQYFETIKVDVLIVDINDNAPQFSQDHLTYELSENTPPGVLFPINLAVDSDSPSFGVKKYELFTNSDKFQLATRNTSDGSVDLQLILKEPFDREEEAFYKLQVIAKDGGMPPKSGTLTLDISVLDANDNSPKFLNSTFKIYVSESMEAGSTVGFIKAVDPDEGINGQVRYSFTSNTQRQFGDLFRINPRNGELKILEMLDYEHQKFYSLVVVAQDRGQDALPSSTRVEIHVYDENDNRPEIVVNSMTTNGMVQVKENAPVDTFVAHISVIDHDSGDNGRVKCTLDDLHFKLYEMLDKEFKVLTAVELDREDIPQYKIHIECHDKGLPKFTATSSLTITVLDENDHAPQFILDRYEVELEENNPENQFLMQVRAHDEDIGANGKITYEMGPEGKGYFSIDPKNGAIAALKRFDREKRNRYDFNVYARDNNKDEPQVTGIPVVVRILDADDEKPKFMQNKYTFSVYENKRVGTEVGQVLATDDDLPPNSKFSFYLDAIYTPVDVFQIDPVSGIIHTKQVLDRERQEIYHLTVIAQSDKHPNLADSCQVEVFVTDKNDNAPRITYPTVFNNTIYVSNQLPPGHVVTQIIARDPDFGENGDMTYIISEGTEFGEFVISPETGRIMVNTDLSEFKTNFTFPLVIMVKDNGRPQKMSVATLNIIINKSIPVIFTHEHIKESEDNETLLAIIVGAGCGIMVMITAIILAVCLLIKQKKRRHHRKSYYTAAKPGYAAASPELKPKKDVVQTSSLIVSPPSDDGEMKVAMTTITPATPAQVSFALTTDSDDKEKTVPLPAPAPGITENGHLPSASHLHEHLPTPSHLADHLPTPGHQDSDSGCYADLSHTDSQGSNDEGTVQGNGPHLHPGSAGRPSHHSHHGHHHHHKPMHKDPHHHPLHHQGPPIAPHPSPVNSRARSPSRHLTPSNSGGLTPTSTGPAGGNKSGVMTPPHNPTPFTDWVAAEGHNLKRKGHVYRVGGPSSQIPPPHFQQQQADGRRKGGMVGSVGVGPGKSVRFHEPKRSSIDLETDIVGSSSYDDFDVIVNPRTASGSPSGGQGKYNTLPHNGGHGMQGSPVMGGMVIANGYHDKRATSPPSAGHQDVPMYNKGHKGRYQRDHDGSLV